jgi:hypothetical protein
VVVHRFFSQAARLSFSLIWVCDSSEDSSNLQQKSAQTVVSTLTLGATIDSCWNFVPARKLIRWWEVV